MADTAVKKATMNPPQPPSSSLWIDAVYTDNLLPNP
jgi:hypothetical protein